MVPAVQTQDPEAQLNIKPNTKTQTLYSDTAKALNTTKGEIYVAPVEKFKAFYTMGFFKYCG